MIDDGDIVICKQVEMGSQKIHLFLAFTFAFAIAFAFLTIAAVVTCIGGTYFQRAHVISGKIKWTSEQWHRFLGLGPNG